MLYIMDINFEILPLVSLKHIVVASHESFCKNLVDYFRQAALVTWMTIMELIVVQLIYLPLAKLSPNL